MILVDAHCHLDHWELKGRIDEILRNAEAAGVRAIITNGINPETNRESLELAKRHNMIKAALGIYPIDALRKETESGEFPLKWKDFDVDSEIRFIEAHKESIVAIGEIGLDFSDSGEEERKAQEVVFRKMLELAKRIDKPVIIHSRSAELRVIEILEEAGQKNVVMHCFGGRLHLVKRIIKNGWYFSIPTNIVRSEQLQKIAELSPMSKLLTETDAPYLSPFREKRNEPAFVAESIPVIAKAKGMDGIEVANAVFQNYQRLFLG